MSDLAISASGPHAAHPPGAAAVPAAVAAETVCITCGTAGMRAYCPACGQPRPRGRFTLRGITAHLVADAFDLNRGLLFTALELLRRPGPAVRDYVAGRTVRYANPVRYLLILAALTTLVYLQMGITTELSADFTTGLNESAKAGALADAQRVNDFVTRYMNLFLVMSVPFAAMASRLFFRRSGYNLAENLVFNTFVYAQACLFFVLIMGVVHFGGLGGQAMGMVVYMVASTAYYAWAAAAFFRERPLSALLRTVGTTVLSVIAYMLVLMAMGIVWAVARIAASGGLPAQ